MPVERGYTTKNGERVGFYQWGDGKRYFYEPGNDRQRRSAKRRAEEQQRAAYASGYKG